MLQLFLQAAPLILPAGASWPDQDDQLRQGASTYYLETMDIENPDQFFVGRSRRTGTQLPQGGQGSQPRRTAAGAGGEVLGITGPGSIDPAVSPGAQISQRADDEPAALDGAGPRRWSQCLV